MAPGLKVEVVSNATHPLADMIALWPTDARPTHLFVCVEVGGNNPNNVSVQRITLGASTSRRWGPRGTPACTC